MERPMHAPEGFILPYPVDNSKYPPPGPPKFLKHQVYDTPEVFDKVDNHAIAVSQSEYPTFRDLMFDLVFRYKLNELEKARVIFRWMTSKNMNQIEFANVLPNTPEDILTSFKLNKGTFAKIFEVMCSFAGLVCLTISGYAKGVDYLPGDRFEGKAANHSWNVILIQGAWQLIDAHWATRYLSSDKNLPENVVYEYDDFYFIMEPQQAVYSHFPEDPAWQLLPKPLTLAQFENLPLTKSQFFKCGMDFLNQHHGVVYTQEGKLQMSLGYWKAGSFTYKVQFGDKLVEQIGRVDLKSFVLQETVDGQINFFFRLPAQGVYYLTVYAQELTSQTMELENTFRAACEYKIVCDQPAQDARPYPACHDANWGPAWAHVQHYGLEPSYSEGVVTSVNGKIELGFIKHRPEVTLLGKLRRNGVDDEVLDQFQRVDEKDGSAVFYVALPEPGEYGLEIYANEPAEGDTYTHMCQYMVHFPTPPNYVAKPGGGLMGNRGVGGPGMGGPGQMSGGDGRGTAGITVDVPLREMYNYEQYAPSLGTLPRPYTATQYTPQSTPLDVRFPQMKISDGRAQDNANKGYQYKPGYEPKQQNYPASSSGSGSYSSLASNQTAPKPGQGYIGGTMSPPLPGFPPPPIDGSGNPQDGSFQGLAQQAAKARLQPNEQFTPGSNPSGAGATNTAQQVPPPPGGYKFTQDNTKGPPSATSSASLSLNDPNRSRTPTPSVIATSEAGLPKGTVSEAFRNPDKSKTKGQIGVTEEFDDDLSRDMLAQQPYMLRVFAGKSPVLQHKGGKPGDGESGGTGSGDDSPGTARKSVGGPVGSWKTANPGGNIALGQKTPNTNLLSARTGGNAGIAPSAIREETFSLPRASVQGQWRPAANSGEGQGADKSGRGTSPSRVAPGVIPQAPPPPPMKSGEGTPNNSHTVDAMRQKQPYLSRLEKSLPRGSPQLPGSDDKTNIPGFHQVPNSGVPVSGVKGSNEASISIPVQHMGGAQLGNKAGGKNEPQSGYQMPGYQGQPGGYKSQPGNQGQLPGYQGQQPGNQGQLPGYQGQHPGNQGQHPGSHGQLPGYQGQQPGFQGQHPSSQGQHPGIQGQQSGYQSQQPGYQGQQPGNQGPQPGFQGQHPGIQGQQPGYQSQQPGNQGQQPGNQGQKPGANNPNFSGPPSYDQSFDHQSPHGRGSNYGGDPSAGQTRYQPSQQGGLVPSSYGGGAPPNDFQQPFNNRGYPGGGGLRPDQYNASYLGQEGLPSPLQAYRPEQSTANWESGPVQSQPPKEFAPVLVEPETSHKPQLTALPPELTDALPQKEEAFQAFKRIDEHAVAVSQQTQDNFNQLIWQLIYARKITDDLERVRAIFLWLCTKDLHKMNFDHVKPDSPEEILMGIRSGKSTYAQIFLTLCQYAGLHCKLLLGYAKGAEYVPGMHFSGRQGQHSWNAVLVSGVWRLVDCHWAARRLIGKAASVENVRYELDMFYFLANPSQLIYTHFPHDMDWQLLRHTISLQEFESLAPVKSAFFKCNLELVTHRMAVIQAKEDLAIKIGFPQGSESRLSFTFTLQLEDGTEDFRGIPLSRYGRQEMNPWEHSSTFYLRFPTPGPYKVILYTKESPDTTAGDTGKAVETFYGAVCEYRVEARFPDNSALPPFPPTQNSIYGPHQLASRYQLQATTPGCSIRADRGTVELRFRLLGGPLLMMAKLKSSQLPEEKLNRAVLQRIISEKEAVFAIFLPDAGEFGLEIYANDPKKDGNSFYAIWQYFIVSDSASPVRGLPALPPTYLGPMPRSKEFGLEATSHRDPFIQTNTGDLVIQLHLNQPIRITTQLIHASHDVAEDCSPFVLQQMKQSNVYFLLRFPHPGYFKFQIFGLPYSDTSESLPGLYNYVIEATQPSRSPVPFPQQFSQWKEGCYLYEPLDGHLSRATPSAPPPAMLRFNLDVPKATAVAVVAGEEWTQLDQTGVQTGKWQGQIPVEGWGTGERLSVCANYGSYSASYSTLLEYTL